MDHNYSGEVALLRDTFIQSEMEHIRTLAQIPQFLQLYAANKEKSALELSERLNNLTQQMEYGNVDEVRVQHIETEIAAICLALRDAVLTKEPIEKTADTGKSL